MIRSSVPNPEWLDQGIKPSSTLTRMEQGLSYLMQGRLTDGLDLLSSAQEQLPAGHLLPGTALGALQEAATDYLKSQQLLHEASRSFALADRKYQELLEHATKLLRDAQFSLLSNQTVHPAEDTADLSVSLSTLPNTPQSTEHLPPQAFSARADALPVLYATCFGHFSLRRFHEPGSCVELCRSLKGQAILRYLLIRPDHKASVDILMADLWPEEEEDVARHKLQVAVSALRSALNRECAASTGRSYILHKDRTYLLNPTVEFHTDVAEYRALYQKGCRAQNHTEALAFYEQACTLYAGPFLVEDLYSEWSFLLREELTRAYLTMCSKLAEYNLKSGNHDAAGAWALAILKIDRCDEEAYRQLMRAYAISGRRIDALRCYQHCQQALTEELGIQPMPETQQLLHHILHGE